jgi:hypothetical protein
VRQARASGLKRGNRLRTSVGSKVLVVLAVPGEETLAKAAPGDEADAELLAGGQDFGFGVACPQGVLALDSGDGLDA